MAKGKKPKLPKIPGGVGDYGWHPGNVSAQNVPALTYRTVLEVDQLREVIADLPKSFVADVGAGYGRLIPALMARETLELVAFEREPVMRKAGRLVYSHLGVQWPDLDSLFDLPIEDEECDLVMSYTVLQHMTDGDALAVVNEMRRILQPGGHLVICENCDETDRDRHWGKDGLFSNGRSVDTWSDWVGYPLEKAVKRVTEKPAWREIEGYLMVFRKPL